MSRIIQIWNVLHAFYKAMRNTDVMLKSLKSVKQRQKQAKEKEFTCRYSVLLHLPPVRRLLIDPMHNLLLGSAKYVVRKIWMVAKFLSDSQIGKIHERMERLAFPVDMG